MSDPAKVAAVLAVFFLIGLGVSITGILKTDRGHWYLGMFGSLLGLFIVTPITYQLATSGQFVDNIIDAGSVGLVAFVIGGFGGITAQILSERLAAVRWLAATFWACLIGGGLLATMAGVLAS